MIFETQYSPPYEETKEDSYDHNKTEKASQKLSTIHHKNSGESQKRGTSLT